jgi:hypothetical protein
VRTPRLALVIALSCWLICSGGVSAQTPSPDNDPGQSSLRQFLRTQDRNRSTRYVARLVDLNGDGSPEAVVYLTGPYWCGSGGCTALILAPKGGSWRIVTRLTIVQLPVRVLSSTSHRWHDLAVWVQGGGIQPGYEALLRFNGRSYPSNPSVPPARRLRQGTQGEVIIDSTEEGLPIYGK